ncbi:E2F-associated phosphoprotein isoform X2 [Lingula anatina]|uniref:E2F-associated phosphoprotein isoform X2 n=1 Tax=Lingula anatina TaxID=7574 RepID=A0A1S3KFJ1_LINAN|nr:E2F-associated phosphoprotein isoform X2 [Lingula anatina]|eukprot:XP_013421403.1 E2F-associated phosphoprotein isoform X2 [Lingula anatina]
MDSSILVDYDGYDIEEDSDQESADSSEDEIHQFLHGTPEQKRRIRRRSLGKESSSEDEFEKEMNMELDETLEEMERERKESAGPSDPAQQQSYDNIYFDSDEEENKQADEGQGGPPKHPVLSNDDLLYDPGMDDEDQRWVDRIRERYQPTASKVAKPGGYRRGSAGKGGSTGSRQRGQIPAVKPLPKSDAVLNCPACMTSLCLDCQRHDLYKEQYRAMFVMNCKVDRTEILRYPKSSMTTSRKRKKNSSKPERFPAESDLSSVCKSKQSTNSDRNESIGSIKTSAVVPGGAVSEGSGAATCDTNSTLPDSSIPSSVPSVPQCPSGSSVAAPSTDDVYYPVKCSECNTEVGVVDKDEIFHFFNVLASYT